MFSDECVFLQFRNQHLHIRKLPDTSALDPRYTLKTVKHAQSVMVWGCFGHYGRGLLKFLAKGARMNTKMYLEVLGEKLKHGMSVGNYTIFQQDRAPCHVPKAAKQWFSQQKIELLDWPGNSLDLNPIENLWCIVKTKLTSKHYCNIQELKEEIVRLWCTDISKDLCEKLVESMPRRIRAVIGNKGFPTKYHLCAF